MFESMFIKQDAIYREEAAAILTAKGSAFFGENEKRARLLYKRLAAMFHPDVFADAKDKADAEEVFKALGNLWDAYECAHSPKSTSPAGGLVIDGVAYGFGSEAKHLSGSVFKVFDVISAADETRLLLIARKPNTNTGTANLLARIQRNGVCTDLFPKPFSEVFNLNQADGCHEAFLIHTPKSSSNIRSLQYVKETGRLDAKDIAWIWRRVVSAAAVCADLSIGFVFDICLSYIEPEHHGYVHMGLSRDTRRTPDGLTQAAACMIPLCDEMPAKARQYFNAVSFAAGVSGLHPKELLSDFDYVIDKLWGVREFHPFRYPKNWV